jgi:hypothetical protein
MGKGARLNQHWFFKKTEELAAMWRQMETIMSPENIFGPFDVLCLVLGPEKGRIVASQEHLTCRGGSLTPAPGLATKRSRQQMTAEGDDEDSGLGGALFRRRV